MKVKYFAYGSNLHPARFADRVPEAKVLGIGYLPGYELRFHKRGADGSGKANAFSTADAQHAVHGIIYEIPSVRQQVLDQAEVGYDSRFLEVQSQTGSHRVFTYIAQQHMINERLLPFDWYKAYVTQGAGFHGLDRHYLELIHTQNHTIDPDEDRRSIHLSVLDTQSDTHVL